MGIDKDGRFLLSCIKCKHKWIKRTVEDPNMCPNCKSRKWKKEITQEVEEVF